MVELNPILVLNPLQIVTLDVLPVGFGFTVTSTVKLVPTQPFGEVGVTVYLTTPAVVLLGLVNACAITPLLVHAPVKQLLKPLTVPDNTAAV